MISKTTRTALRWNIPFLPRDLRLFSGLANHGTLPGLVPSPLGHFHRASDTGKTAPMDMLDSRLLCFTISTNVCFGDLDYIVVALRSMLESVM